MKRTGRVLAAAVLATSLLAVPLYPTAPAQAAERASVTNATFDPNNLLVKFKVDADQSKVNSMVKKYKLTEQSDLGSTEEDEVAMYDVGTSASPQTVASELVKSGLVDIAEPDYDIKASAISNDASVSSFWGLSNTGQTVNGQAGISGVDVNAANAWTATTGNGVTVAVLDEGTDIDHPELASHIWTNSADCFTDGIDHDGNGYVNDCHGWDFVHGDNSVYDPADGDDHGTHVCRHNCRRFEQQCRRRRRGS